nr:MAG TPA: hypothetical protein [Caudoviricetes sp.]
MAFSIFVYMDFPYNMVSSLSLIYSLLCYSIYRYYSITLNIG